METKLKIVVVLDAQRGSYPRLLTRSRGIYTSMSSATVELPNPSPTMVVFGAQVDALGVTQQAMTTRAAGTKQARDAAAELVLSSLGSLQQYVQSLCDASPSQAKKLIAAAAMKERQSTAPVKPVLGVKLGTLPGSVTLVASRSQLVGATRAGCVFAWEYSVDSGKTWITVTPTSVARAVVTGLPSATTVAFRVSASTTKVAGAWSQVITTLVH